MKKSGLRSQKQRTMVMHLLLAVCLFSVYILFSPTNVAAQDTKPQPQATSQVPAPKKEATAQAEPSAGSFVTEAEKTGRSLKVTLKDAMKMALQNNLTIAIQDYESENYELRKIGDLGVYDPTMTFSSTYSTTNSPNTSPFNRSEQGNNLTSHGLNYNFGLQQTITTGGQYSINYNTRRSTSNSNSTFFSPSYNLGLTLNFSQPLIKNFRINNAKRQIRITKLDSNSNDITFEDQVTTVVKNVQDAYWDLVFAIRNHEIMRNSLGLAKVQLDNNKRKVEIGTLAPIEITSAEATVSTREQSVISALERIHNLENRLKQLLSKNSQSDIWDRILLPTDEPLYTPVNIQLAEAIQAALTNRPEIRKMQNELTKLDIGEEFYRNQRKPQVDFVGSFGTSGVAGGLTIAGSSCVDRSVTPPKTVPCVASEFVGGVGTANKQVLTADFRNWALGVQVQIPLRNRTNESQLGQQLIAKRKMQKQLTDLQQSIGVEVRNAYQAIETTRQRVDTAKKGTQFALEQLQGENKRFEAGLSTTFLVLDRQDRYQQAQGSELQALVDYRKTVSSLYKAMFQTIDKNDIEIAKQQQDSEKNP